MAASFRLTTESGRRAATQYARSGLCPQEAERIERLVKEAREHKADPAYCRSLEYCLEHGTPTPAEIAEAAEEARKAWATEPTYNERMYAESECDYCEHCGKGFRSPVALILHIRENHQPAECDHA